MGGQAEGGFIPAIRPQIVVLCSQWATGMHTNCRTDREGHWQQFGTHSILISAPQWPHRPCNASMQFYRVRKKAICESRPGYLKPHS